MGFRVSANYGNRTCQSLSPVVFLETATGGTWMSFAGQHKLLDDLGWSILEVLQREARVSFSELGRRVGLSTPAVTERVRRMEEAGIITGYHAAVDPSKAGFPIVVYMRLAISGGGQHGQPCHSGGQAHA